MVGGTSVPYLPRVIHALNIYPLIKIIIEPKIQFIGSSHFPFLSFRRYGYPPYEYWVQGDERGEGVFKSLCHNDSSPYVVLCMMKLTLHDYLARGPVTWTVDRILIALSHPNYGETILHASPESTMSSSAALPHLS